MKAYSAVNVLLSAGFLTLNPSLTEAQTCSCAGVALSHSINLAGPGVGRFQFGLSFTDSDISDLVAGSTKINDETGRKRRTTSYLFQTAYGVSEHWSLTAVIPWIRHIRNIRTSDTDDEKSSGVGDTLVVLGFGPQKIDPFSRHEWGVGVGIRAPTGRDRAGDPVIFAEDLQPGQGAWGSSAWLHYGHSFNQRADRMLFADASISKNGNNVREYSFEGELNLATGVSLTSSSGWNGTLAMSYRIAQPHKRFGSEIPNTGGKWLDFAPSLQYSIFPSTRIGASASIPLSRDLNGSLQFSTKRSLSLSMSYLLGRDK